jgi:hypothetical protein
MYKKMSANGIWKLNSNALTHILLVYFKFKFDLNEIQKQTVFWIESENTPGMYQRSFIECRVQYKS